VSIFRKAAQFYNDPDYFRNLLKIAFPIAFQQLVFSLLNMLANIFVAQKGDAAVAAVGLAGQVFFLLNLVHFGIISGAGMFTAQFWGKRDIPNLRRVLGLCLMLAISASLIFFGLAQLIPSQILHIYSKDPVVIQLGAQYIRTFSWTFLFFGITFSYAVVLRSTGNVKTPTVVSVGALLVSIFFSYSLIFGKFGLPELGIQGAAVAAVIARCLECVTLLTIIYTRNSPVAASIHELTGWDRGFFGKVMKPMLPVILNELLWSLGITTYQVIYGQMSTQAYDAINIVSNIEQVGFAVFMGISNATAILVGNRIGAGREEEAHRYAGRSLGIGLLGGILLGILLHFVKGPILALGWNKVSPEVTQNASNILTIVSLFLWIRINNMTTVVGILRAGGDTRFSLFLDGMIIWIVGVPMAYLGAFVFDLPVYFVYLCAMSEETTKWVLGIRRYLSRKWINNLTVHVESLDTGTAQVE
jgi:putative MATE family efflux protein